jgi:pimeloyl-ACP methyl ester carboxylesterase
MHAAPAPVLRTAAAFALALAGACLAPVRVESIPDAEFHDSLDVCALHGDVPSARTAWFLRLAESEQAFRDDPIATVEALHWRVEAEDSAEALFALSELSYLAGKRRLSRECYLAAAVYAHLYLLHDPAPSAFDRRFRWACDIYNRSLVRALQDPEDGRISLEPGVRELPAGWLRLEVDCSGFPFVTRDLELIPADELRVVGLTFRVRDSGLGAPVIAVAQRRVEGTAGIGILDETSVSATLFLRLEGDLHDVKNGISAVLELHSTYDEKQIEVAGVKVPLEADLSASIAYGTQAANLWRFDTPGFFEGQGAARQNGLILPRPFEPGRIPVVLVHGTAANPAYWAELVNSLCADPVLRGRIQFWLFIYATGNPIAYSAASLRESLQELVAEYDPDGRDEALRHMVIVGHSQGGLLTKMLGVRMDQDGAGQALIGTPFSKLGLEGADADLVRRCFEFEPLPTVDRLVFVATPHRGSFFAERWYARFFAKLIAVPEEVEGAARHVLTGVQRERLPPGLSDRFPTSIENMDPSSPFVRYLAELPIDPRIHTHSIVPIGTFESTDGAHDGVVSYASAHLDGVESEVLVPAGHSCQSHPRMMIELRRILREHIRLLDAADAECRESLAPVGSEAAHFDRAQGSRQRLTHAALGVARSMQRAALRRITTI